MWRDRDKGRRGGTGISGGTEIREGGEGQG